MQLTKAEEQVMRYLWNLEKAYLKNILEEFPEPNQQQQLLQHY